MYNSVPMPEAKGTSQKRVGKTVEVRGSGILLQHCVFSIGQSRCSHEFSTICSPVEKTLRLDFIIYIQNDV